MTTGEARPVEGDLAAFVRVGLAVIVGTGDDDLEPAVTRGWGARASSDGVLVELCVAAPSGSRSRANLRPGRPIAVTFSVPTSYVTTQIKGRLGAVTDPSDDQLAQVDAHVHAFAEAVAPFGLSPEFIATLRGDELRAVTIAVDARFDQTPGQGAGSVL